HELNIRFPFGLVSNAVETNQLIIFPAYWVVYNMYAMMRNTSQSVSSDQRKLKNQYIENDVLSSYTVNKKFKPLTEIEKAVGKAYHDENAALDAQSFGRHILSSEEQLSGKEVLLDNVEFSKRKVVLAKPKEAYVTYQRMIRYYGVIQLTAFLEQHT